MKTEEDYEQIRRVFFVDGLTSAEQIIGGVWLPW